MDLNICSVTNTVYINYEERWAYYCYWATCWSNSKQPPGPPIHVNTIPHENTRLWLTATHGHLLIKQSTSTLHAPTFGKHVKEVITPRHQTLIHSHFEINYSWAHPPSSSAVTLKHTFRAHRKMTIRCLIDQIDQCVRWILLLLLLTSDRCLPWFSSVHVCLDISM